MFFFCVCVLSSESQHFLGDKVALVRLVNFISAQYVLMSSRNGVKRLEIIDNLSGHLVNNY